MSRSDRRHTVAVWTAVLVTILWSSSWVLVRVGLDDEDLQPVTFAGLRYGLAALILLTWCAGSPRHRVELLRLSRSDLRWLVALGAVFYMLTQGAQFVAIDNQPAATTSLVLSFTPLVVGFTSARSLGEHATRRQLIGAALVAAGAFAYFAGDLGATRIGLAAALVGLGANATSSLLGRSVNRDLSMSPLVVTAVSMTIGAVGLLATGTALDGSPTMTLRGAIIVAWLAATNTALAFTLWNMSLRRLSAVESTGINNTMLIQIAVLAWIFLDEPPGIRGIAGVIVVTVGVVLTQIPIADRTTPSTRKPQTTRATSNTGSRSPAPNVTRDRDGDPD